MSNLLQAIEAFTDGEQEARQFYFIAVTVAGLLALSDSRAIIWKGDTDAAESLLLGNLTSIHAGFRPVDEVAH